jgi:SPX domain protein involved in polyphosphate accumulation
MKFGKDFNVLKDEEWKNNYINYDLLKQYNMKLSSLKIHLSTFKSIFHQSNNYFYEEEEKFLQLFLTELNRCTYFIKNEYESIITKCTNNDYESVTNGLLRLEKFINLNQMAVYKIIKKHDKYTKINYSQSLFVNDIVKKMYNFNFNKIIIDLNKYYIKDIKDIKDINLTKSVSNSIFIRKSYKYLVKPENITLLKLMLAKDFQIKFYHSDKTKEYQSISSIYFDSDTFKFYNERLIRIDNAKIVRFRWYEESIPKDIIYAEIKTHSDDNLSSKERVSLNIQQFIHFINGHYQNINEKNEVNKDIVTIINNTIINENLQPVLRTVYNRTTFESTDIKITFDTDLYSFKETKISTMNSFNRYDLHLNETDLFEFNYGILEIKTECDTEIKNINSIKNAIDLGIIEEVPKFSKFITCCYNLYKNRINEKPYWYDKYYCNLIDIDHNEISQNNNSDNPDNIKLLENTEKITKFPIVINSSVIIANERLFLKWLGIGLKLIFINQLLIKVGLNNKTISFFTYIASIGIIGNAIYKYFYNIENMINKKTTIIDKYIPLIIGFISIMFDFILLYYLY